MGFLKDLGQAAESCAHRVKGKTSRAAAINRLRTVVKVQESAAEKEYLALGRYYYNALQDKDNPIAQSHCARLDKILAERDAALNALEEAVRQNAIAIFPEEDGPTAVAFLSEKQPVFHFEKGPIQVTVTKTIDQASPGEEFDPLDENSEEIDLGDVECFDHDPMATPGGQENCPLEAAPGTPPAEPDENDGLPFEG